jgi:hypothetical protein
MHLGFHLQVVDSREARRLHALTGAVPVVGLLLASWQSASGPVWLIERHGPWSWALAVACFLSAIVLGWLAYCSARMNFRAGPIKVCSLQANAQGLSVSTLHHSADRHTAIDHPATVSRILRLPGLIVMELTPTPQTGLRMPRLSVVLGRSSVSADSWRRLNVWLVWVERGTGVVQPVSPEVATGP